MEKEYIVITKRGINVAELDYDLASPRGGGVIPKRAVEIANERYGSNRMTHFMLTEEEAEMLSKDNRIISVEIPPEHRDDISIGLNATQEAKFYRGASGDNNQVNWGLRRSVDKTNTYGSATTTDNSYTFGLDGTGVDIVIQDSGIEADHPEWEDSNGVSRLQKINWYDESGVYGIQHPNFYSDTSGHGTHVAGIAAGKTYGWAKNAHIYSQKLNGLQGPNDTALGIGITESFDILRLWHLNKTNGRPTVVNMSWGYGSNDEATPLGGVYRGQEWTNNGLSGQQLWDNYGIVNTTTRRFPSQQISVDIEIEEMIDAGIHVCIAAGNGYYKADLPDGDDYNNYVTATYTHSYHKPGSPYCDRAFFVGNIHSDVIAGTNKDRPLYSSNKGPAVNIWAPGTAITSTCSSVSVFTTQTYPNNSNFKITTIDGTSMASPQVAGLCALHLQSRPEMTPDQLLQRIINDSSKGIINQTANNNSDYSVSTSICGSPNRLLYNRYNKHSTKIR